VTKIWLFGCCFEKVFLRKESQHAIGCGFDDVEFAEEVSFVIFVDLSLTDKDVVERFLYQHVENVALLVLEQKLNQIGKETNFTYARKDSVAGDGDAVAEYLQKTVVVKIHLGSSHYPVHSLPKQLDHRLDHRLLLYFVIATSSFSVFVPIEGGKGVVVNEGDEETEGWESHFAVVLQQPHHYINRGLVGDCLDHLFPIDNQVVLVHSLNENRTQILNNRCTIWTSPTPLLSHLLNDCFHDLYLHSQTFWLGS
jgi:hypothetical protein